MDLEALNKKRLLSYEADPGLLKEHHGIEQTVLAGGYGYRQIFELVQNGADAILEAHERGQKPTDGNRIHVLLRNSRLYVANTGAPLSSDGVDALLRSHSSPKRGNQIGRFGLGFKSLLRLQGCIDLFTRTSGAIRFDPQRCRDELKRRFGAADAPGLRLAWALDENERKTDGTCGELAWAETIVRVEVRTPEALGRLQQEIGSFPAEFLLFFPVATILVLDDGEKPPRELRVDLDTDHKLLHDGADHSLWRVASRTVTITDPRALADATHIHARESVPLDWAVPLEGRREEVGRFWAFFPTHTPTYVPGILNAPWKLNSDRNAIIGGEWNEALMAHAARLIADTLPQLSSPEDPARPLDAFPRQLVRKDEDAAHLVATLWEAIETSAVVPDVAGTLRAGGDLWRHPRDNAELVKQWETLAGPVNSGRFVHSSCLERQRNSRLNALADRLAIREGATERGGLRRPKVAWWFGAIASSDVATAIAVLNLAEAYASDCKPEEWNKDRPLLAVIPSQNGDLLTAPNIVLAPEGTTVPDRATVASALYSDAEAKRILTDVMKVQVPDDRVWEKVLRDAMWDIQKSPPEAKDTGWRAFWSRLRQAPAGVRERFSQQNQDQIRVRRRDGTWAIAGEVLLPGGVVGPDDTSANQNVLVDEAVHREDSRALTTLGVCQTPEGDIHLRRYDGFDEWLQACRRSYKDNHDNSASMKYLVPFSLTIPKGMGFLRQLRGRPNAYLTKQYLRRIAQGEYSKSVRFGHGTVAAYPETEVPHPLPWFVLSYGSVEIGDATVRLASVVARRKERVLLNLPEYAQWNAALDGLSDAWPDVKPSDNDVRALWLALFQVQVTSEALADDLLSDLWAAAAKDDVVPEALPSLQGPVPLSQVFVTSSPDLARLARNSGRIVVTLDEPTSDAWVGSGAQDLSRLLEPEWSNLVGPASLLSATVPELTEVLHCEATARCQPVSELRLKLDGAANPVPCLMWQGTLLLDAEQLAGYSRAERLRLLLDGIAPAGWLNDTPEAVLRLLGDAQVDMLRADIARETTMAAKLLRAVGGRREPLLEALGTLKDKSFVHECSPFQLAELTLRQLGPATLTALKKPLSDEGLHPPQRWNTSEARVFVASIGFPAEFASAPEKKPEAEETISGPIELPPLHDFQEEVMKGIETLLASGTNRRRAVVSLPTGGGKTRVTVEAAVRLVLAPEGDCRCVVWVAQTQELCEQAVQAFRQVWVNLGAQRTDLRIVRLWGSNPNPVAQPLDRPVVVIGSIQTLNSRMETEALAWLKKTRPRCRG